MQRYWFYEPPYVSANYKYGKVGIFYGLNTLIEYLKTLEMFESAGEVYQCSPLNEHCYKVHIQFKDKHNAMAYGLELQTLTSQKM